MKLYKITDWHERYETYETKKLEHLRWVPTPNKHDGLGFRRLVAQKDRCELFAAWNLMLQIASKNRKQERGILIRDGAPMDADDLSLITGFPKSVFDRALSFFSSREMQWLAIEESTNDAAEPPAQAGDVAVYPLLNGREENGREKKRGAAAPVFPAELADDEFQAVWRDWEKHRREIKKPLTPTTMKEQVVWFTKVGRARAIAAMRHTIAQGWQGLREPEKNNGAHKQTAAESRRNVGTANEGRSSQYEGVGRAKSV